MKTCIQCSLNVQFNFDCECCIRRKSTGLDEEAQRMKSKKWKMRAALSSPVLQLALAAHERTPSNRPSSVYKLLDTSIKS